MKLAPQLSRFKLSIRARRWLIAFVIIMGLAVVVWQTVPFHMPPVLQVNEPGMPPYSSAEQPLFTVDNPLRISVSTVLGDVQGFGLSARQVSIIAKVDGETVLDQQFASGPVEMLSTDETLPYFFEIQLPETGLHFIEIYVVDKIGSWFELKSNVVRVYLVTQKNVPTPATITGILPTGKPGEYIISGFTDPYNGIIVDGLRTEEYARFDADQWGRFDVIGTPLNDATELIVYSSNYRRKSSASQAISVKSLDHFIEYSPESVETNFSIKVTKNSFWQKFELSMPSDYPGISDLIGRRFGLGKYLSLFVGSYSISGYERVAHFENKSPKISIDQGRAKLDASVATSISGDINAFGDSTIDIKFSKGFPLPGNSGKFSLSVEGLQVKSVTPRPDFIQDNEFTWNQVQPEQKITLVVSNAPLDSLWSIGRLQISDFTGRNFWLSGFLYLLLRLVVASPLILGFWLLDKVTNPEIKRKLSPASSLLELGTILLTISLLWDLVDYTVSYGIYRSGLNPALDRLLFHIPYFDFLQYLMGGGIRSYLYDIIVTLFFIFVLGFMRIVFNWSRIPVGNTLFASMQKALFYVLFLLGLSLTIDLFQYASGFPLNADQVSFWLTFIISVLVLHSIGMTFVTELRVFLGKESEGIFKTLVPIGVWIFAGILAYETGTNLVILREPDFAISFNVRMQKFFDVLGYIALPLSFFPAMMLASYFGYVYKNEAAPIDVSRPLSFLKNYWADHEKIILLMGVVLFAGYIVRSNDRWILIPVSLIISIPVFWNFLIHSPVELLRLKFIENIVRANRPQLLSELAEDLALKRLQKQREDTLINLANGKIVPSDYEKTIATIDNEIKSIQISSPLPKGIALREVVLAFGPAPTPFQNAVLGLKWALWLHIPLLIFFARFYLLENLSLTQLYLALDTIIELISYSLRWLTIGFFLGYMFDFIKGNSGLRKALYFSAAVALSILPFRLSQASSTADISAFIFEVGQIAIFSICVGLALDWETIYQNGFGISFLRVVTSDIPSLVSVSSVVITTVGIVLSSILTGQLTQLLNTVLVSVLPTLTSIPGLR